MRSAERPDLPFWLMMSFKHASRINQVDICALAAD
jgi:hypothetical protein